MKARIPWSPSKEQKKAMNETIKIKSIELTEKLGNNMDASALYALHRAFGFGKKRLRRFYDAFIEERKKLTEYYEMDGDADYLCKVQLKKIGVDIEAWNKELDRRSKNVGKHLGKR